MDEKISLSSAQILFIIKVTGINNKNEAVQYFASLMIKEGIAPSRMGIYVDIMMQKEEESK